MKILNKIPGLDLSGLDELKHNAERTLASADKTRSEEARVVLDAIAFERSRRQSIEVERKAAAVAAISDEIKDLPLVDRIILALRKMPPRDHELAVLRAIAAHPGQDFTELARAVGYTSGTVINLIVGCFCAARQAYLGPAPVDHYSGLIIDFERHELSADVGEWHGWSLKPEALAALRASNIL